MNGTMGTSASAGGNPSRYSASQESAPQTSTYGQNARTCFRRSQTARPIAAAISRPLPPAREPSNRNIGASARNPTAFEATAISNRNETAGCWWKMARTRKYANTRSMPATIGQPRTSIGTVAEFTHAT
jgi:hypothetical protein